MIELYKKLSEVKSKIGKISKDSTNPFYKSKYFDINKLLEHLEPLLLEHNLLLIQPIISEKVVSIIIDLDSGEQIESVIPLTRLTDPQKLGIEITYYRRYTLTSLLGLQAEDDDANATVKKSVEVKAVWLNETQFNSAMLSSSAGITATLSKYSSNEFAMKKEYREQLTAKLKTL